MAPFVSLEDPFSCNSLFFKYFFTVLGLIAARGFSLVVAITGYSLVAGIRLLIVVASLVAEHRL